MTTKQYLILLFTMISTIAYSQGSQNDFDFDNQDLNIITKKLGFHTFKFPIRQTDNQLFDIVIEEFENGKLLKSISLIDNTKEKFKKIGVDAINYFKPDVNDSIFLHRFYFQHVDTIINLTIKTHGMETKQVFDISEKSAFDLRALYSTKTEIDSLGYMEINNKKTKPLMFLYANSVDDKDGALWCPAGIPKDKLTKQFYYIIYISIKEYDKHLN